MLKDLYNFHMSQFPNFHISSVLVYLTAIIKALWLLSFHIRQRQIHSLRL
jgi:hypothetical protein